MSEKVIQTIVRAVFTLALLGFGLAFALTGEAVFAGGLITAALSLAGSITREIGSGSGDDKGKETDNDSTPR